MTNIFLSYAREDLTYAKRIFETINSLTSIDVWFDQVSLLPGQKWELEIRKAIRKSRFFILLLSNNSVNKRGFFQKEVREGLDVFDELPENEVYLIPIRLEKCQPHFDKLKEIHYVDLFPNWNFGISQIITTISKEQRVLSSKNYIDSKIRFKTHIGVFDITPSKPFYFITLANLNPNSIEVTHIWYEDSVNHIKIENRSRSIPKKLEQSEAWETWISINDIPNEFQFNAYNKFRVRLSTGEIFDSEKDDSVPPYGSVPGGRISIDDLLK